MANLITLHFKPEKLQELLKHNPDYVLITADIVSKEIDGKKVGVLDVKATAHSNKNKTPLQAADGCPVPPCQPGGGG